MWQRAGDDGLRGGRAAAGVPQLPPMVRLDEAGRPARTAAISDDFTTLQNARAVLVRFRHHDVVGSLADLHDALHPNTET